MIALVAFISAATSTAGPTSVDNFRCAGPSPVELANVQAVHQAYQQRSVEIVRLALANSRSRLTGMVDSAAKFTVFHGDVGLGPRDQGIDAAVEFAKQISPRTYEYSNGSGPVGMNPCGLISTEVTFSGDDPAQADRIRFKYEKGVLTEVSGGHLEVTRGHIGSEGHP